MKRFKVRVRRVLHEQADFFLQADNSALARERADRIARGVEVYAADPAWTETLGETDVIDVEEVTP